MAAAAAAAAANGGEEETAPVLTNQRITVSEINDVFTFHNAIGKGGYADVYKVTSAASGSNFACKAIPKFRLTSESKRNKVKVEIGIHSSLDHDHVVRFVTTFEDDVFIFIVLEYCQHRSMNLLIKTRITLTDPEVRYFLVQVTDALAYLHSRRIIHRDLKAGNILLKGSDHLVVKLCDFGLSAILTHDAERRKTICGTPNYIAPEILQNSGHSYEADVWSLACLMFALLTGKPPFQTKPIKEIYSRVMQAKYRIHAISDPLARDLIKNTLITDPERRVRLSMFRNHDYFNEWYPSSIGTNVYDDVPPIVREYLNSNRKQPPTYIPGEGGGGGAVSTVPSRTTVDMTRAYTTNTRSGTRGTTSNFGGNSVTGSAAAGSQCLPLSKRPNAEYRAVVASVGNFALSQKETVALNFEHLTDDGCLLTQHIENCINKFKRERSLRHIPVLDTAMLWAIKWVDYSDTNQGFGYQLSDSSYGVLFRGDSKIIMLPDGDTLLYMTRKDSSSPDVDDPAFTADLREARSRLDVFVDYMNRHLVGFNIEDIKGRFGERPVASYPFPVTWTRGWDESDKEYLIIIVIRPAVYQINFEDHSKVIVDYNGGSPVVMYQKDGQVALRNTLQTVAELGYTDDLLHKLTVANHNFRKLTRHPSRPPA